MATELNTAKTIVDQPVVETPGEVIAEPSPATPCKRASKHRCNHHWY